MVGVAVRVIHGRETHSVNSEAHSPALHLEYGVLDIHYEPRLQCFGAATSTGLIALFRISHEVGSQISMFSIQSIQSFRIVDPNTVLTCFAWNPKTVGSLAIGAASGEVFLVDLSVSTTVTQQKTPTPRQSHSIVSDRWRQIRINRHEESCWTVAFSILERSVYSGGDDSAFISTRYTSESDAQDATGNILSPRSVTSIHDSSSEPCEDLHRTCNYKLHRAGITAIVPLYNRLIQFSDECHELVEFLATGSYDECFRVVMARHGRGSFTELLELPLGGGVWRIKVMIQGYLKQFGRTFYVAYLSVSCMQAGARVIEVRCDHGSKIDCCWKAEVVAYYQDHGSLVYDTAFFYGHNGEPIPSDTGPAGFWIPELSESCEAKTSDPSQTSFEVSSESLQEASMKGLLRRVVTSSFYDKTLCVSHMKLLPCLEKPGRRHLGDEDNASF